MMNLQIQISSEDELWKAVMARIQPAVDTTIKRMIEQTIVTMVDRYVTEEFIMSKAAAVIDQRSAALFKSALVELIRNSVVVQEEE